MKIHIYGCGMSNVTVPCFSEQGHDVEIFEVRDHIAGAMMRKTQTDALFTNMAHIFFIQMTKMYGSF